MLTRHISTRLGHPQVVLCCKEFLLHCLLWIVHISIAFAASLCCRSGSLIYRLPCIDLHFLSTITFPSNIPFCLCVCFGMLSYLARACTPSFTIYKNSDTFVEWNKQPRAPQKEILAYVNQQKIQDTIQKTGQSVRPPFSIWMTCLYLPL
jgi:hypothetical protein